MPRLFPMHTEDHAIGQGFRVRCGPPQGSQEEDFPLRKGSVGPVCFFLFCLPHPPRRPGHADARTGNQKLNEAQLNCTAADTSQCQCGGARCGERRRVRSQRYSALPKSASVMIRYCVSVRYTDSVRGCPVQSLSCHLGAMSALGSESQEEEPSDVLLTPTVLYVQYTLSLRVMVHLV